jgi:acyl carrier protein
MTAAEVREPLRRFIRDELIRNPHFVIADDEPLITGGIIDSFSLAEIAVFIEQAFNAYIPDIDLTVDNMDTLNQMVARVMREMKG